MINIAKGKSFIMADVTLQFSKSSSKQYKRIVERSKRLAVYREQEGEHIIELSFSDIINDWDLFNEVYLLVSKWSSFRLTVKGGIYNTATASKFYYAIQDIKTCYRNYLRLNNIDRYCNDTAWKCVKISSIKTRPYEYGTFWYALGHFNDDYTQWIVHKEEVKTILKNEIENKGLHACPMFSLERIFSVLNEFPDIIELKNNSDWEIVSEKKFVGSHIKDVPKSIRHIVREDDQQNRPTSSGIAINPWSLLGQGMDGETPDLKSDGDENVNPFTPGTNDWANWEIDNYENKKRN